MADWLTRANSSTCPLLKLTVPSAREIALKFDDQLSTRFRDRVNVTSPPSLVMIGKSSPTIVIRPILFFHGFIIALYASEQLSEYKDLLQIQSRKVLVQF
jgi:hypothetical protein